jgi:hypothetical protein
MSSEIIKSANKALNKALPDRHSYFQLRYFVIGKEPTVQAKMWQCLREIKARAKSLENINLEIEESNDNKELLDIEIEKGWPGTSAQEAKIRKRKQERKKKRLEQSIIDLKEKKTDLEQETEFFLKSLEALEKIEALKDFDDTGAQIEYWSAKLSEELNLRNLFKGPLDMELIKTILALPDGTPIKTQTVNTIENVQKALLEKRASVSERKDPERKGE